MPKYQPSPVSGQYDNVANSPYKDKVCFTIDHIHLGSTQIPSTYDVVKYLTDKNIPVTIFVQCHDPLNNCSVDKQNIEDVFSINPMLVSFGVHTLPRQNTSHTQQLKNFNLIKTLIEDATNTECDILSYHGHNAGPISGLIFPEIRYARGVTNVWTPGGNDPLNTPVVTAHTIKRCLEEIEAMNNAGLVPTFFFHTHELISGHGTFKSRFDNIVNLVLHQKLAAVPYLAAMETSFNDTSSSSGGGNNIVTRPCRISASEIGTLRPIKVDFSIVGADGQEVDSATNLNTEVFTLPVGDYTVKASINGNIRDSKNLTLTSAGGLHVIVYV